MLAILGLAATLGLVASCRAPTVEDVPVRPCRITAKDRTVELAYEGARLVAREERRGEITFAYDDAIARKRYARPLDPPHTVPRAPCPILIRTNGREVRPQYRDGRLVDDGAYIYVYDAQGRPIRVQSIRSPEAADVYTYECP